MSSDQQWSVAGDGQRVNSTDQQVDKTDQTLIMQRRNLRPMAQVNTRNLRPMAQVNTRNLSPMAQVNTRNLRPMAQVNTSDLSPMTQGNTFMDLSPMTQGNTRNLRPMAQGNTRDLSRMAQVKTSVLSPIMPQVSASDLGPMAPQLNTNDLGPWTQVNTSDLISLIMQQENSSDSSGMVRQMPRFGDFSLPMNERTDETSSKHVGRPSCRQPRTTRVVLCISAKGVFCMCHALFHAIFFLNYTLIDLSRLCWKLIF
jgi:hypothetical protein